MSFNTKTAMIVVFVLSSVIILIAFVIILLSGKSSASGSPVAIKPGISSVTPMTVYHPPSARQVADSLGCKKFKDNGPSEIGGSIDSGACWIGKVKYAINTFPSTAVRNAWLDSAEPLGVAPKWETDTSVTYKSVT